jgi:hypothetical protein
MQGSGDSAALTDQERLFLGLAEQLARPFLQVARLSELAVSDQADADPAVMIERWQMARAIADASLQLVESYALSLRVQGKITPLRLEQVTVSALLYDTAHGLHAFARQYGVELQLDAGLRMQPVLADRTVLTAALTSLGQVFILAQAEAGASTPVRLSAHRGRYGVVAGLYTDAPQLGAESLRRAHTLQGRARQPLQRLVSGPAAGVFVADSLLRALAARLHVARYRSLNGLATTLQPSQQLQLV